MLFRPDRQAFADGLRRQEALAQRGDQVFVFVLHRRDEVGRFRAQRATGADRLVQALAVGCPGHGASVGSGDATRDEGAQLIHTTGCNA